MPDSSQFPAHLEPTRLLDAPRAPVEPFPPPEHPPQPLPMLDGYELIQVIGRGGMGLVYEGYQRSTGRRVAVKFMHDFGRDSEPARRRFEREVELAARLSHPNIV